LSRSVFFFATLCIIPELSDFHNRSLCCGMPARAPSDQFPRAWFCIARAISIFLCRVIDYLIDISVSVVKGPVRTVRCDQGANSLDCENLPPRVRNPIPEWPMRNRTAPSVNGFKPEAGRSRRCARLQIRWYRGSKLPSLCGRELFFLRHG